MRPGPHLNRLLLTLLVAIGGLALVVALGHRLGHRHALADHAEQAAQQLHLHAQALDLRIERYRALPQLLALDPDLRDSLAAPIDAATRDRLNRRLEETNLTTLASTLTLIDTGGTAIAASNWRESGSNVGEDYAFRPYVQQALAYGHGRFYGIGVTTGIPGYFLSEALRDEAGRILGVIVIKIELTAVEAEWAREQDVLLLGDARGIVFLAGREDWRWRTLSPLDPGARDDLIATRQYGDIDLQRYLGPAPPVDDGAPLLARIDAPSMPGEWLWERTSVADTGWSLHLLRDAAPVAAAANQWAAIAGASWLVLVFVSLFAQQRARLGALRLRSRAELEALVEQHARELRTARDGLVEAAQRADVGLSRQLEHLPQGVVIIDADLRITAWNARYIELFRFPPDLVQVGRPIEDVFRYNARRGLLGPGPVEDAIQRRLDHLRSGKPHMRESEKDDGLVLEIRGNPLPDGGFVTSYADITSYKATARELRSLADALERRVARRTADLEQARRAAVEANRYKTRFVAAAVHDLLQPLNAARMFLSTLRSHLQAPEQREVADHVDAALAGQDAILNSLLDISRLESGSQQTDVRDFALDPLLDALAREFGILARARGLELTYVRTGLAVRSDAALLRRVVQNLISNAVRYTKRGRILLGCRRVGDQVRIEVRDTGPGIPHARQREIFEEFRRLDEGSDNTRGAGLGLAIVERIARLLGHRIGLDSQPGRGSMFSVTVPRAAHAPAALPDPVAAPPATEAASPLRGHVVWYVDDDAHSCIAARTMLERWGCRVPVAAGADAALAAARENGDEVPALILLDLHMGATTGPEVFARLVRIWRHTPQVVLLTGDSGERARAIAQKEGWQFLPKPVRPPALRALMTQLLLRGA
ncbi:hybrid sensor histidine kinase/response regulator [Luteimonas abyssi]|uniref:hybrid sensor histidine kinase/response regulator n=1 Tax=Luteimonas abyssi TaxID=1247514 RepID=UPI000737B99A|nr:PAS-domain containing protein [Luteimonas abyssi]